MTKRIGVVLGLMFAFGVGCGAGVAASSFVVPKASAQQARVTRWENVCVPDVDDTKSIDVAGENDARQVGNAKGWNRVLAQMGAEGWELVGIMPVQTVIRAVCFKRPLP